MASPEARLRKLEKKAATAEAQFKKAKSEAKKLKDDLSKAKKELVKANKNLADANKEIEDIIRWIKAEAAWSADVTKMLRLINWADLAIDYPGAGGSNPPQTPPDWPMD